MPGYIAVLKNRRLPVCMEAPLHEDFKTAGVKLIPMVFMHGAQSAADEHCSIAMQMASHGYCVFSMDSMDGQCAWTTDADGKDIWFDTPYELKKAQYKLKNGYPNPESMNRMNL